MTDTGRRNSIRDHRQTLVAIVDDIARADPETIFAEIPRNITTYEEGFRTVTYKDFANAVNGLAWWLKDTLGPAQHFPTVCYMGGNDGRYQMMILACVKAGYKALFTSPRNSLVAHCNLFKVTDCHIMATPDPPPPFAPTIAEAGGLRLLTIPSLEDLLYKDHPHFPYEKPYEQAKGDPLVVLHTSGTTGLPKPIVWTHEWAASWWSWTKTPLPEGYSRIMDLGCGPGVRLYMALPPFHAGNLFVTLLATIWTQNICIYWAGALPSGQGLIDAMKYTKIDVVSGAPPLLEDIGKNIEFLDAAARNLRAIFYVGGDLSQPLGNSIAEKINLFTVIGATEMGITPSMYPTDALPKKDWKYFRFNPGSFVELEPRSDNLFECVVKRNPDVEKLSPVFRLFPDRQDYPTKDLFSPHPTEPGLWSYEGRADDIIVFLNGEKTNPTTFESQVAHHPEIRAVLVIGALRFQAALLIEAAADKALSTVEKAELIERLWPTIQQANQDCPHFARVSKSFIFFTDPTKPMERAGKGTIQRRPTLEKYAREINSWYADAENVATSGDQSMPHVDAHDYDQVSAVVQKSVADIIGLAEPKEEDDFVAHGMDSLKALELTRDLKRKLGIPELDVVTIYLNASVSALSKTIVDLAAHGQVSRESIEQARREALESSLKTYTDQVDQLASRTSSNGSPPRSSGAGRVVALTGSTGALGSFTLQSLVETPSISKVYCLNRAVEAEKLQGSRNEARGLPTHFPPDKVTFLTVDLEQPKFGLESSIYSELQSEVTDVIHTAWTVNFNLALGAYQDQLSGLVNLISFASTAKTSPSILFVSSATSIARSSLQPRPEQIVKDVSSPSAGGYGESKWLAERILDHAATKMPDLNVKIARSWQLAGAAFRSYSGWNRTEWFPAMIISSYHLGAIPETLGFREMPIDWVPIDVEGNVLVDLVLGGRSVERGAEVFNTVNPHRTSWDDLLPSVMKVLHAKKEMRLVSYEEWLKLVRADAESWKQSDFERHLATNPAIKIMAFYEFMHDKDRWPRLSAEKAQKASKHLERLDAVRGEWMENWVKGWI